MAANHWRLIATVLAGAAVAVTAWAGTARADAPSPAAEQKTCPVLTGNPIDPSIYTDHQGKRVYFCCTNCKAAFESSPEKYLAALPQFAGQAVKPKAQGKFLGKLIVPLGVTTLSLVACTVALGLLRRLKPRPLLRIHKAFGIASLTAGATHALVVLLN